MVEASAAEACTAYGSPRIADTARGRVEYADFGEGPAVVALHGAMGGYDQSAILAHTVLGGRNRIIAISRPGYLGTPLSSGRSPDEQADLVAALLDLLSIERAGVIAISGGGPCALAFAHRHPERCSALVLISTVSGPNPVSIPLRFQIMKLAARIPLLVSRMRAKALANLEATAARSIRDAVCRQRMLNHPSARRLFVALTESLFDRMAKRLAGTDNDIRVTASATFPLEEVAVPTLIVHGTCDERVDFTTHAATAQARIPGARLLRLEGGEHAAIFTHRDQAREGISCFLRDVPPR